MKYPVVIIGGGLAGLVSSIELARAGIEVLLIERKDYPHHKVCGEYISNEVRPYLENLGLPLDALGSAKINRFRFTSPKGLVLETPLEMGGFGISRYALDQALYELANQSGVGFQLNTIVQDIRWVRDSFEVETSNAEPLEAEIVIGAFGKRTRLDKQLDRDFMKKESPYVGIKYHIRGDFSKTLISLHNFRNGYCGMSAIEDGKYCLCYLTERSNLKESGNIPDMEKNILSRNPHLKDIFDNAEFLYDKPEVINEISFAPKNAVENHILMAGDSAGLITPLCGNGMAMAIRAGNMVAWEIKGYFSEHHSREILEKSYAKEWQDEFALRLKIGRNVQSLFGREVLSEMALGFFKITPTILNMVIKGTHGKEMSSTSITLSK